MKHYLSQYLWVALAALLVMAALVCTAGVVRPAGRRFSEPHSWGDAVPADGSAAEPQLRA